MSAGSHSSPDDLTRQYESVVSLVEDVILGNLRGSHPLGRFFAAPAGLSDAQRSQIAEAFADAARVAVAEAREAA